jgi:hypothetical protein
MVSRDEIESYEAEMLRAYSGTVQSFADDLAAAGLTANTPSLRRWSEDDLSNYGSEIEMSLFLNDELEDALDLLLFRRGHRQLTAVELTNWLTDELRKLTES